MSPTSFRRVVWSQYKKNGRHDLPWRKTRDPYKILVSEVMLQQTQVERVLPYYADFTKRWPTARALAKAPLADVLRAWQGLGYNRRAKMLHNAAKQIAKTGMPQNAAMLQSLPGVGPYTAAAVAAFAYDEDGVVIETNIRTAVMHHFFPRKKKVSDADIESVLRAALPKGRAHEWYSALMDYGAHLKRTGARLNAKSKHYTKQSRFVGSNREARGAILRELAKGSATHKRLGSLLGDDRAVQLRTALGQLRREGLVSKRGKAFVLTSD